MTLAMEPMYEQTTSRYSISVRSIFSRLAYAGNLLTVIRVGVLQ
jgi:hypothetical protein